MFRALWCWLICVIVTVVVSLMTKPKPDPELNRLVYGADADSARGEHLPSFTAAVFWASVVGSGVHPSANHLLVGGI